MSTSFTRNSWLMALGVAIIVAIWKTVSMAVSNSLLAPSPEDTFKTFIEIVLTKGSFVDLFSTLFRGLTGFFIALLLAMLLGLIAGSRSGFNAFLSPFLVILRSTPVVAFILLLLIWFETDSVPVIIAFITMLPVIYTNITKGIQEVDASLKEMAQVYQLSRFQKLRDLYLPSIYAFVFGGISTALGFGWRAIIIGEVLSQPVYGIGSRMREAYGYLEVQTLISWTIIAVLLSFIFEMAITGLEKHTAKWKSN
jgi:NitT/TauT family transport system permease protein